MTVVPFPKRRSITVEEAWANYVRLKERADRTLVFEDGRAAARAWWVFYNMFTEDEPGGSA